MRTAKAPTALTGSRTTTAGSRPSATGRMATPAPPAEHAIRSDSNAAGFTPAAFAVFDDRRRVRGAPPLAVDRLTDLLLMADQWTGGQYGPGERWNVNLPAVVGVVF